MRMLTFQLRSPQKRKIGLHSPDPHKMLMGLKAKDNVLRFTIELDSRKHPALPKKQTDVILILCKHE